MPILALYAINSLNITIFGGLRGLEKTNPNEVFLQNFYSCFVHAVTEKSTIRSSYTTKTSTSNSLSQNPSKTHKKMHLSPTKTTSSIRSPKHLSTSKNAKK